MSKTVVKSIRIDEATLLAVDAYAIKRGMTFNSMTVLALDRYIKAHKKLALFNLEDMEANAIAEMEQDLIDKSKVGKLESALDALIKDASPK